MKICLQKSFKQKTFHSHHSSAHSQNNYICRVSLEICIYEGRKKGKMVNRRKEADRFPSRRLFNEFTKLFISRHLIMFDFKE